MHGLINRSIQCFVHDTYGADIWAAVADASGIGPDGFEAMLSYDDALTKELLSAASSRLDKPREVVLEDLGTFLVSHTKLEPIRRLLRFGGESFVEFLHSLDDLPGRAKLAVPDLEFPELELVDDTSQTFRLICRWHFPGASHVMLGVLRAMADDYGALALLEHVGGTAFEGTIRVELLDSSFSAGRSFELAVRAG
ncbi:heme NO-binding domain-containing protein [Actibacterium lipolyticum]|uniref:Heme NO binding protein n=1 Tax=Actibacterium lipolyticum TaxID=1524263 RepID=A0A238JTW4_9RHOB|nr:heme NO-binding domain-containing protein [Actibacterium lipolyticum]SMX33196.1 Heme NO binding protein [Actibacterium lipolyticum]